MCTVNIGYPDISMFQTHKLSLIYNSPLNQPTIHPLFRPPTNPRNPHPGADQKRPLLSGRLCLNQTNPQHENLHRSRKIHIQTSGLHGSELRVPLQRVRQSIQSVHFPQPGPRENRQKTGAAQDSQSGSGLRPEFQTRCGVSQLQTESDLSAVQ